MNEQTTTKQNRTKEIDVVGLAKKVLKEKWLLAKFIAVFAILGVVYAFNKQKEYTSIVVLAPEASSMGMSSSLSDIAGMVGLNLGGNNTTPDAIYPEIYPDVFSSPDFIVPLFDIKVSLLKESGEKTYSEHIMEDYKMEFWRYPMYWLGETIRSIREKGEDAQANNKKPNLFQLSRQQEGLYQKISGNIGCQMNKGTNIITISVTDIDPKVAAIIADTLRVRLQEYITNYRTSKARVDLEYYKKLAANAKQDYERARQRYGSYSDRNMEVVLESYRAKQEDLENDMQLKFNNYSQTFMQVQQAQAKLQERTPAFTVIQSASVPLRASSIPRLYMLIGFILLGCICDALWVLFLRQFFVKNKSKNSTPAT